MSWPNFPINICYSKSDEDKYYVIDFEPGLIGIGPYAYDIAFFILYASDLISKIVLEELQKKFLLEKSLIIGHNIFSHRLFGGLEIENLTIVKLIKLKIVL